MRHELSHILTLRYTPELVFEFDVAMEHGDKIQRLLMQLEQEEKERAAAAAEFNSDATPPPAPAGEA